MVSFMIWINCGSDKHWWGSAEFRSSQTAVYQLTDMPFEKRRVMFINSYSEVTFSVIAGYMTPEVFPTDTHE